MYNNHVVPELKAYPNTDFTLQDIDHFTEEEVGVLDFSFGDKIFPAWVLLADLPAGCIDDEDDWEERYIRESTYPPITLHWHGNRVEIIDGNHRRVLWAKWGFTHGPAWIMADRDSVPGTLSFVEIDLGSLSGRRAMRQ